MTGDSVTCHAPVHEFFKENIMNDFLKELGLEEVAPEKKWIGGNRWEKQVSQAKDTSILDVCERLGIALSETKPNEFYGLCPFHDDEMENLHVEPAKARSGLWYCFTCTRGGDALQLYMDLKKKTFPEAVKELSNGK